MEAALTEPVAVCYHSYQRSKLKEGDNILVLGDGPFGYFHAVLARILGADQIIVAGHYDKRLERIADAADAITCNTHKQSIEEVLHKSIRTSGIDVVIEATGNGAIVNTGLKALRPQGTMVVFSYIWKPDTLEMGFIHMNEIQLVGACRSLHSFEPCLELIQSKQIEPYSIIDGIYPLDQWKDARIQLQNNKQNTFKVVFNPNN
jgi:threonine dehydrogenase-like Zn-dependent dehydrogenase